MATSADSISIIKSYHSEKRPLTIYVDEGLQSQMIIVLLHILELSAQIVKIDFKKMDHLLPEFILRNPEANVPLLEDDDILLTKTPAILTYLVNAYGEPNTKLYHSDDPIMKAITDQYLTFQYNTLEPRIKHCFGENKKYASTSIEVIRVEEAFAWLDTIINREPFLIGEHFSLADLTIGSTVQFAIEQKYDIRMFPRIKIWYDCYQNYIKELNTKTMINDAMRSSITIKSALDSKEDLKLQAASMILEMDE